MKSLSTHIRLHLPFSSLAGLLGAILFLISAPVLVLPVIAQPTKAAGATVQTFPVGIEPSALAFDGANIWVVSQYSGSVTKLRASDGANQGTFAVGRGPQYAAYDGANIWVSSLYDATVTKLRASDGALLGTYVVGEDANRANGLGFDGPYMWV